MQKEINNVNDGYVVVRNQELMNQFLDKVDGFHDALLREIAVVSRGYVDSNGWMHGDMAPSDARLVFQSQFPESAHIDVVFEELKTLKIEHYLELEDSKGVVSDDGIILYLGHHPFREEFMVIAKAMKYKISGSELWGEKLVAVHAIPDKSMDG